MKLVVEHPDGRRFVFEGEAAELAAVANNLEIEQSEEGSVLRASGPGNKRQWTEQTVRKLLGLLWGDQAKLVKFLVSKGRTAEYGEIEKHMGYKAQRLSGILSAITRNSHHATGDRLARLIDWRFTDKGKREYSIDSDAYNLLKRVVG